MTPISRTVSPRERDRRMDPSGRPSSGRMPVGGTVAPVTPAPAGRGAIDRAGGRADGWYAGREHDERSAHETGRGALDARRRAGPRRSVRRRGRPRRRGRRRRLERGPALEGPHGACRGRGDQERLPGAGDVRPDGLRDLRQLRAVPHVPGCDLLVAHRQGLLLGQPPRRGRHRVPRRVDLRGAAKPFDQRALPMVHVPCDGALDAFAAWTRRAGHVTY